MGPHQNKKLLKRKKTALKLKENQSYGKTYLPMIPQTRVCSKIYKELTQFHSKKTSNPIKKMGKGLEQTLLQGGYREGLETYERMLSISSHQRNAN